MEFQYIVLNKPKEYISVDPITGELPKERMIGKKNTINLLFDIEPIKRRSQDDDRRPGDSFYVSDNLIPVDTLNFDSEGLMVLTDDKEMVEKIRRSNKIYFTYYIRLNKPLRKKDFIEMRNGFHFKKHHLRPWIIKFASERKSLLRIKVFEKSDVYVRKVFASLGYEIEFMERIKFGTLTRRGLVRSQWRELEDRELNFFNQI
ncbi:hypothetical protein HN695_05410 [Candidatus Woesearchaeota archaeon]|jgi:pseudouridine synthase|nr:hypothetical protein [Candidatus Woesearchaeota archaeon]MBT5272176.1 hypothetical protein [Candidatus Woesearchaeota archaeon]MBT6040503.1 hypothetical protein [Candidatus Woesearchaeota archaeon]MBT6336882.1 hypothetical protein [Candidatus Woesearchaeota archaeon]MBT7927752.1 hypothetical protein [Candidatus Woesearchaeota archaeon]